MKCQKCLQKNQEMIRENGYGRSYIPSSLECKQHGPYSEVGLKEDQRRRNTFGHERRYDLPSYVQCTRHSIPPHHLHLKLNVKIKAEQQQQQHQKEETSYLTKIIHYVYSLW